MPLPESASPPESASNAPELVRDQLAQALETRSATLSVDIARLIEGNPALAAALSGDLQSALETQPDALYAFVRARLAAATGELPSFWMPYLHQAAAAALETIIGDGDSDTMLRWLTLLAREPASYSVGPVLRDGLSQSIPFAEHDPALAHGILSLAVRREPSIAKDLLSHSRIVPARSYEEWLALLVIALKEKQDALFLELVRRTATFDRRQVLWKDAFAESHRSAAEVDTLISQLQTEGQLDAQQALDLLFSLIEDAGWSGDVLPLMGHAVRLLSQTVLHVNGLVPWKFLEVAARERDDSLLRGVLTHVTEQVEGLEDDESLLEMLMQLWAAVQWSEAGRTLVLTWWRGFAHAQPIGRLSRLDQLLAARREAELLRTVTRSLLVVRRLFTRSDAEGFAERIAEAATLLQVLHDAFDQTGKRDGALQSAALRAELASNLSTLSPQARRLLAGNMRELAALIATLADQRTRVGLIRRDDVDRQLATDEMRPSSAVDALKWIAGYLDGSHGTG